MPDPAYDDFVQLWSKSQPPDLLVAALHVARIAYPALDLAEQCEQVEHLAELAQVRLADAPTTHTRLLRLNHFLFDEMGFRGDTIDYYNPRNSFLNDVLARRSGIPITLSVLYLVVGRRAGLELSGVGLPAHFVVRHETGDPMHRVYIDPYHRQILPNREACRRLVSRISGQDVQLSEEAFVAQTTSQIIVRMLANLKGAYLRLQDFTHALAAVDRLLVLLPNDAHQWRDRGLLHYQMGSLGQSSYDLTRYLWLAKDDEDTTAIRNTLESIEVQRLRMN